jgi:hypothetical protein
MQLNRDWRTILRHYSSVALSTITLFSVTWAASPEFQAVLPPKVVLYINLSLAVFGFVGKFIKQSSLPPGPQP